MVVRLIPSAQVATALVQCAAARSEFFRYISLLRSPDISLVSMSPTNIIVLSHRLPYPPNKGEKIRTFNQLELFRASGSSVTIFCPVESDDEIVLAEEYAASSGFTVVTVTARHRKLSMLMGLLKGRAFSVSNFYSRALQTLIDEHLQSNTVDAVYCTSSAMAEYLFKANKSADAANPARLELMDFMDLDSDKWRQYREISSFPMSLIYRYEEWALARYEARVQQRFDACVFISANEVELFQQKLPHNADNLHVIGNGVDLNAFRPKPDLLIAADSPQTDDFTTPLRLLFSGVMDYLPNENAMLWFVENVWDSVKQKRPDAELVIAGMNPSSAIQELAKKDGIIVTGFVDDMLACYHDANIFIAPFQIARGVQNKVLQAFACGLPVVTTAVGAEGIDCHREEHYALAETPEEFLQQIMRLAEDPNHHQRMAQNAIRLVNDKYTWDAMNAELFQLFSPTEAEAA